jgi:tetratricopeptide (TPR) repeat protein/transglutaminase-like putative cysteine protease
MSPKDRIMLPSPRRTLFLGLLISFFLAGSGRAADDWPVARRPSREPDPYRYEPAHLKQAPREFLEDSAACILYSGSTYLVEPDGTVESITHEITRLNGRKGVETLGEYNSITWDPAYQKVALNEARVIKSTGKVVKIEPRHVQVRDVNAEYAVYDTEKQLVISFPNLEVGDIIEVKWTSRGKSPEFGAHFFTRYNFGDDRYPAVRDELRVRLPRDMAFKHASINGKVEPVVRDLGKERLYLWRVNNRPELPQDSDLPSKEELRLQVMCSTFASWEEVSKWKQGLRAQCWECTPAVRDTARQVTAGLATPLEKARALTYWVRRRVRYVSFSSAHHGYTPHQPGQVHENLFGDCKDQAQLLAVMLREVGVPVALVTLGTRDDGQVVAEVPSPWGTHAILLVSIDGKDHWIDTTASMAPWDFLPRSDRDRMAYVTNEKGIRVLRTPGLTPADNRYEQATEVWVQPDGTAHCRRSVTYHGLAALSQRDAWTDVPPGERRRLMSAELQDANSRTRLRSLQVEEKTLRDLDQPVRAAMEFDVPEQLTGELEKEGSFTDSRVWGKLLGYSLDYERKVALDLWAPFESVHRYTIHLPPGFRFETFPSDRAVTCRLGSFQLKVLPDPAEPRRLQLEFRTRIKQSRVDPADFAAFRKLHQGVYKNWRAWVTLAPTHDPADALALEAALAMSPGDRVSATILARLYQSQGRLADASRVVKQALAYHPKNTSLWELAVSTAASLEQEEAVYRAMTARFPGETKYAVAVGRICVSRGLHERAREVLEPLTRQGSPATRGQAHYHLARSAMAQKQPALALTHLVAARAADGESVAGLDAVRMEGQAHELLGQKDEAIRSYRQALAGSPDNLEVLAALVRLEIQTRKPAEALDHLRRYTLAVGGDLEGLVQAATFHLELGRYEDAFDLAGRARDAGFHAGAQRVLGLVYLHRGDCDKAVFHLERAQPDGRVLLGLIRAQLARGNLSQVLLHARTAAALSGPPPELGQACALTARLAERKQAILKEVKGVLAQKAAACAAAVEALVCAELAFQEGRPAEQVTALLARAFPEGVEIGPAYGLRGQLALEQGRLGKALADADRATTLAPGEARGHYVRGRVRLERGQGEATADLARAAQLSGRRDALMLHWLATALAQQGRAAEALAAQREAVALRPHDAELQEQLRALQQPAAKGPGVGRGE